MTVKTVLELLQAWKLWSEGDPMEIIDEQKKMKGPFSADELVKCIQVGLLCVQQRIEDWPTMSSVLTMLSNESIKVPQPESKLLPLWTKLLFCQHFNYHRFRRTIDGLVHFLKLDSIIDLCWS